MADLAKLSLFLRRLGLTFLLAFLLFSLIALVDPDAAWGLFLPCWIALLIASLYLNRNVKRKVPSNIPTALPPPRRKLSTAWGRVIVTGLVAFGISFGLALLPVADIDMLLAPLTWIALYYGWPALRRRLPIPESWKVSGEPDAVSPVSKIGIWRLLGRGALAMISTLMVLFLLPGMMVVGPIGRSMVRARGIHDSIHVGMSVPEVLDVSRDCDIFGAGSDFPYDKNGAGGNNPAMNLHRDQEGTYRTYDPATNRNISMTETQAVERLHVKLHDAYQWRFSYTYINITPMHVSFSVVFGPDGRVSEVTPVHGWD
jgi:hypothetical protein